MTRSAIVLSLLFLWFARGLDVSGQDKSVIRTNPQFEIDRKRVLSVDSSVNELDPAIAAITPSVLVVVPAKYTSISLHVSISRPAGANGQWRLRFLTNDIVRDEIGSDSERGKLQSAWSSMIKGNSVLVELSGGLSAGSSFVIDRYAYQTLPSEPQGIIGKNYMQSIGSVTPDVRALGVAVSRLRTSTDFGEAFCTGFLVSTSLLLTNNHCIETQTEAANSIADFGFDSSASSYSSFRVQSLEASSIGLDYSIVRVSGSPGKLFAPLSLEYRRKSFSGIPNALMVIEHPAGRPKQISIRNCTEVSDGIAGVDPDVVSDFSHLCNTVGGSSGSPVFLASKELIGLHHLGFTASSTPKTPLVNQAVHMSYVIDDLVKYYPKIAGELHLPPK